MKSVDQVAAWAGGNPMLLRLASGLLSQLADAAPYQAASGGSSAAAAALAHLLSGPATLDRHATAI